MKKALVVLFIMVFAAATLFAANDQKIWSVQDDVYQALESLYVIEGRALPSATGPWSTAELKLMLSKTDRSSNEELYDYIYAKLYKVPQINFDETFSFNFSGDITLTGFAHTNTEFEFPYDQYDNYLFRTKHKTPTLYGDWEAWAGKYFYSYFSAFLTNERDANNKFDQYKLNTDLVFFSPKGLNTTINQCFPTRAFAAIGSDHWSVQIGRDRLNIGNGETGNMNFSDVFDYNNLIRFTTYGTKYKYTFLLDFFAHPIMANGNFAQTVAHADGQKGLFFYMAHRMEGRFFNDKLALALTESIVYQSEEGILDLRFINPAGFFHNYFIKANANSIVTLEADYTFRKNLNAYAQFCMDDIKSPNEIAENDTYPTALGFMLGLKGAFNVGEGVLSSSVEGVYTMPYLYLRAKAGGSQNQGEYGLGFIGNQYVGETPSYLTKFIGYTYGGDAIVADAKAAYDVYGKYSVSAEMFYMIHGEKNIYSLYQTETEEKTPTGTPTNTFYLELAGNYQLNKRFNVFGQFDFVSHAAKKDIQVALGVKASF